MAAESILTYKKPGFPVVEKATNGVKTTIEYIGPLATLQAAEPSRNALWGDYSGFVLSTRVEPLEDNTTGELTVIMENPFDVSDGGQEGDPGTAGDITYEVEWVMFQRSMFEHPQFAVGGGGANALTNEDVAQIQAWQNEPDPLERAAYQYKVETAGTSVTLSTNAQLFADGIFLGQETYEDYAPMVRITTRYYDGLPSTSEAGLKDEPPAFSGKPTGYEWRKTADRAVRANTETTWERVEEWIGAIKVLTDREQVYF